MADNRTMEEMLQAPTEGITSTLKFRDVPNDAIKLMLFLYSLKEAAKIWYEKEPPRSILTWGDLIDNFKARLKNEIHSSVQNQINNVKNELRSDISNQTNKLRNMMASYFLKDTTFTSGSLPSNTITNPKGDLKAITTRSGVSYDGPPIPPPFSSLPKVMERVPEVTKDTVQPSTENIQPPVAQTQVLIDEPVVAPKPKPTIPYPLRLIKQKLREKDDNLALKLVKFFRKLHFELSFADALLHMPKFTLMFKACEEYVQEVLGFFDNSKSDNPTPIFDPIIALSSLSLTPFEGGDFILEEIEACLSTKSIPPGIDDTDFDLEGDICLLEELLNKNPSSSPLPPKELNVEEIKTVKSSIDEPPELELKELPSHLEYIPWVSPIHCVPKKGGMTMVENEDNELIPTRCMMAIFPDMIEKTMEVFMDDFLVFGDSFSLCLSHLDQMLKRELAADHLSRLESPHHDKLEEKEITETFPLETLGMIAFRGDSRTPWFADIANYYAGNFIVKGMSSQTIGENRASWSDKLDDALWAFRIAFKTPIGCTPYKLVYEKAFHLPIELEHKVYWALKHRNFELKIAGDHQKVQLDELNKLRDQAYENSLIYKEKTKKIHDSKIKDRVFNVADRVILFNSRLTIFSGKLKTRWIGPFIVAQVFPYGTVELSQNDEPNFKVNGHRLKHYFGGDISQLVVPDLQTFPMDQ
nr:reverse transcriptase domain-containing protein [Tanacetum cinerariifolium]